MLFSNFSETWLCGISVSAIALWLLPQPTRYKFRQLVTLLDNQHGSQGAQHENNSLYRQSALVQSGTRTPLEALAEHHGYMC